jgi:hypothetical protein
MPAAPRSLVMIQDFVDALVAHRQAAVATTSGRAFMREVEHFIARLNALPQHPASELSAGQFELVNSLADEMVEQIEVRLEQAKDGATLRQELAEAVYRIRREAEKVYLWRRQGPRA